MPRIPTRLLILSLALVAVTVLSPTVATALPQGKAPLSAGDVTPGLFSELWSLLSTLWSDTGSGLDPDGGNAPSGPGAEPTETTVDTGSGLDPNG